MIYGKQRPVAAGTIEHLPSRPQTRVDQSGVFFLLAREEKAAEPAYQQESPPWMSEVIDCQNLELRYSFLVCG